MSDYLVDVVGCDDSTHVLVDLTPDEARGIVKAADAVNKRASAYCQPTLRIRAVAGIREDDPDLRYARGEDPYDFDVGHEGELT